MSRAILRIAIPSIVSNITVPLLALVDTAIVGHLGAAVYIGAIAVGGMIFNMLYWLFNFLRMGTGGLTAQAYGANDHEETLRILVRSLAVATGIAGAFILLQWPLLTVALRLVDATAEMQGLVTTYFRILIWGAPAVMGLYSFVGWFLGMQNARFPMYIVIVQNVVNILVSLVLVIVCHFGITGVAVGTLTAQYVGLFLAILLWWYRYRMLVSNGLPTGTWNGVAIVRFFRVNRHIFLRTLCLVAVSTWFTTAGTRMGELTLAANALLMQLFVIFSYFMDGFAYAGEALGGRFVGSGDRAGFIRLTRRLFVWGIGLAVIFTTMYIMGGHVFLSLLTSRRDVVACAMKYLPVVSLIPVLSFAAFLFDGLFIGSTSTRQMLQSMLVASVAFFALWFALPQDNTLLWIAFISYLALRGIMQAALFPSVVRRLKQ